MRDHDPRKVPVVRIGKPELTIAPVLEGIQDKASLPTADDTRDREVGGTGPDAKLRDRF